MIVKVITMNGGECRKKEMKKKRTLLKKDVIKGHVCRDVNEATFVVYTLVFQHDVHLSFCLSHWAPQSFFLPVLNGKWTLASCRITSHILKLPLLSHPLQAILQSHPPTFLSLISSRVIASTSSPHSIKNELKSRWNIISPRNNL